MTKWEWEDDWNWPFPKEKIERALQDGFEPEDFTFIARIQWFSHDMLEKAGWKKEYESDSKDCWSHLTSRKHTAFKQGKKVIGYFDCGEQVWNQCNHCELWLK